MSASGPTLEPWRQAWRIGLAPQFGLGSLHALRQAILDDEPELLQGKTVEPDGYPNHAPVGACVIGYCGWKGEAALPSVDDVGRFFLNACHRGDALLASCKRAVVQNFLAWWDTTSRSEARVLLLAEVEAAIAQRLGKPAA